MTSDTTRLHPQKGFIGAYQFGYGWWQQLVGNVPMTKANQDLAFLRGATELGVAERILVGNNSTLERMEPAMWGLANKWAVFQRKDGTTIDKNTKWTNENQFRRYIQKGGR